MRDVSSFESETGVKRHWKLLPPANRCHSASMTSVLVVVPKSHHDGGESRRRRVRATAPVMVGADLSGRFVCNARACRS